MALAPAPAPVLLPHHTPQAPAPAPAPAPTLGRKPVRTLGLMPGLGLDPVRVGTETVVPVLVPVQVMVRVLGGVAVKDMEKAMDTARGMVMAMAAKTEISDTNYN